ncbi:MAG TPA: 2OG-Fe(II) oxygenase [Blastocatellia bacterium]|nr:2OG-Fe(II) oxygenase [Blastocatellia bacterium]
MILTLPGAISIEECRALIAVGEGAGYRPAPIEGRLDGPCGFTVRGGRDNSRASIDDAALSNALWRRLSRRVPPGRAVRAATGLNERIRFYRYEAGQSFGAHRDGYYLRANGERSLLTLMIYLNDDFEGGETYFFESRELIAPEAGKAIVFAHELWHAGREVTRGRKYILRTDVMYEPESVGSGDD